MHDDVCANIISRNMEHKEHGAQGTWGTRNMGHKEHGALEDIGANIISENMGTKPWC